jgi:hypothetical protein
MNRVGNGHAIRVVAVLLCVGCGLPEEGRGPTPGGAGNGASPSVDASGTDGASAGPTAADGSSGPDTATLSVDATGEEDADQADASRDATDELRLGSDAPVDDAPESVDAASDASRSDAGEDGHAGGEGGTCTLPSGATQCCGPMLACTDADGTCAAAGACELCLTVCTNPEKPVCCVKSTTVVTCERTPQSC